MCFQRKEKKKERKKVNQSKIGEKQKTKKNRKGKNNMKSFFGPDNVWANVQNCREQKERKTNSNNNLVKTRGMHEAITFLVTNQIFVFAHALCRTKEKKEKKNKKGKGQNTQKPNFPPKSSFLKSPIDPWLRILSLIW